MKYAKIKKKEKTKYWWFLNFHLNSASEYIIFSTMIVNINKLRSTIINYICKMSLNLLHILLSNLVLSSMLVSYYLSISLLPSCLVGHLGLALLVNFGLIVRLILFVKLVTNSFSIYPNIFYPNCLLLFIHVPILGWYILVSNTTLGAVIG